jgi:hypothetical protein
VALHQRSHGTEVNLAAVFGMNVLEDCLSSKRSWVSNAFVKVLDVLRVGASKAHEGRILTISVDSVHG